MHFKLCILHFVHADVDRVVVMSRVTPEIDAARGTGHTELGQWGVLRLALFNPDTARQLNVLQLQGHTTAVQGDEVGILQ